MASKNQSTLTMSKNKNQLFLQGDGENNSVRYWPLRTIWRSQGSEQGEPSNCPFPLVGEERKPKAALR